MVDKEELLKIARERYPVGTQLKECLRGWLKDDETGIVRGCHSYESGGTIWVQCGTYGLCIYDKGKWAQIISSPEYTVDTFEIW